MRDWQPPLDPFVGRAAELGRLAEILRRAAAGQPWLVAIEGDPGMGKTALARHALDGVRVLSARADPAEADLDYGVVDQLLRSADASVPVIRPEPDPSDSPFRVGAQLLRVADGLQAAGPIGLLVDDEA